MAQQQRKQAIYTGIRGRDGSTTAPIEIPPHRCLEALNVDFYRAGLARKRGGATDMASSWTSEDTTGVESALFRHVPSADETAAELWKINDAGTPIVQRLAGGTAWASITPKDAIATRPQDAWGLSSNGKFWLLADTAQDRMQVFDPDTSTTALRRAGLKTPTAAPTVANTGAGSYAATERWYKVRYTRQIGGITKIRSEASASQSFTPSGTGTAARVTKPASISEDETHWELYGAAAAAGPFYLLATTAVGTTTYDDSTDPSDYSNAGDAEPTAGEHVVPASFKYGIADGARLLFAGPWESTFDPGYVYFTPVLGTTSATFYDDERIPTNNRIPIDPKDGGTPTGFGGPFENQVIVFKYRQTSRLIPTGVEADPYRRKTISKVVGCIRQQSVVMAEDEAGNPTLYWLSHTGPYRLGAQGLQRLVWDVKDIWDTVNLGASTVTCHGVYHSDKHQIWWWVATGSSNEPDTKLIFDTRLGRLVDAGSVRDGWCKHTGESAKARCSVMFSATVGASMSRDLKPYIGQHGGNGRVWQCDTAATSDAGTAFQAYVTFPDRHYGGLDRKCQLFEPSVLGSVGSQTLTVSLSRNYGEETRTATVTMTAGGTETRARKVIEGGFTADASAVAVTIGDGSAVASSWTLDAFIQPYEVREVEAA